MTLNHIGPNPLIIDEFRPRAFKAESPPLKEKDVNRFKDSLDKAVDRENSISQNDQNRDTKDVHRNKIGASKNHPLKNKGKSLKESESKKLDQNKETTQTLKGKTKDLISDLNILELPDNVLSETQIEEKRSLLSLKKQKKTMLTDEAISSVSSNDILNQEKSSLEIEDSFFFDKEDHNLESEKKANDAKDNLIVFPSNNMEKHNATIQSSDLQQSGHSKETKISFNSKKKGNKESRLNVIDGRNEQKVSLKESMAIKSAANSEHIELNNKESNELVFGEENQDKLNNDEVKSFKSRFNTNKEVLLARELKNSANAQIVKKATFILKDNNQGEIKLILKPESLGRVKIQLNMNENNLVGKIIVENSRVGQIFENNLSALSKSFEEAGISSSSIEVSVGDGHKQNDQNDKENQKDSPFYSSRLKTLDQSVPHSGSPGSEENYQLVNLVV